MESYDSKRRRHQSTNKEHKAERVYLGMARLNIRPNAFRNSILPSRKSFLRSCHIVPFCWVLQHAHLLVSVCERDHASRNIFVVVVIVEKALRKCWYFRRTRFLHRFDRTFAQLRKWSLLGHWNIHSHSLSQRNCTGVSVGSSIGNNRAST